MYLNTIWLFFIILVPFSTSVLSKHFGDTPAVFLYSLNILLVSVCQNFIWDVSDDKADYVDREAVNSLFQERIRTMLNLDMLNGLIAVILSFFIPKTAFFILFFKLPILLITGFIIAKKRRKELHQASENPNQ